MSKVWCVIDDEDRLFAVCATRELAEAHVQRGWPSFPLADLRVEDWNVEDGESCTS